MKLWVINVIAGMVFAIFGMVIHSELSIFCGGVCIGIGAVLLWKE